MQSPTLAIGKSKAAKGKVAKFAKEDMAVKGKVHKSKAKAARATVHAMHKVMNKPVGMLVPKGKGEEEPVIKEEPKEEPKYVVQEEEDDKPSAKAYYHVNNKLATAPKVVQEEVSKIKAMPHRSGNQGKLQQIAAAFAKSGRGHKLFKSIEQLKMHKAQQTKAKTYPKQVMVTKSGGEEGFEQAMCGK